MHIKKIVIFYLFVFSSGGLMARELEVKDKGFTYHLSVEKNVIRLKTVNTDVSLEKQKCSAHIIDRFGKLFEKQMKASLAQVERLDSLVVKLDSTSGYVHRKDERAKFLRSIPNQIKQLKIEEALNCKKK